VPALWATLVALAAVVMGRRRFAGRRWGSASTRWATPLVARVRAWPLWLGVVLAMLLLTPTPAIAQADPVEYYHLDAVGSVRVVTNSSGQVIRLHDFKPFGEEITPPSTADRKLFTGQERDQSTGLDYFGARYYRPDLGRFTSADDSSFLDPFEPRSANLYAHAFANPLRWVDPTGHDPQCPTDYCESVYVYAPMPPDQDPGLMRFFWESVTRNILLTIDALAGSAVQAPGLGEADLPLVDRSPDTVFLVAAAIVRPGRSLTPAARSVVRNLEPRVIAMTVRQAIRHRSGAASTVKQAEYMADWTVGQVAEAVAHGSGAVQRLADTAMKMVKQAASKAEKYGGK
jgi:RHS repeat-associated protein